MCGDGRSRMLYRYWEEISRLESRPVFPLKSDRYA
jgi:hypothetical protein